MRLDGQGLDHHRRVAAAWAASRPSCSLREGARVVVADFNEAGGVETVDRGAGPPAARRRSCAPTSRTRTMPERWSSTRYSTYGRVDALYNNAGIMPEADHSVIDTDVDTWDRVMGDQRPRRVPGLQVRRSRRCSTTAAGSIINIASFVAHPRLLGTQDAYTASKGAVLALTRSTAVQFAGSRRAHERDQPRAPIETPMLMDWLLKDEAAKQLRLARNPTGRFGKPEEIVNVGDLPRVGRVALDEWRKLRGRRGHHHQLLLSGRGIGRRTGLEGRWTRMR